MFSSFLWRQLSRCWWLIALVLAGCEKPDVEVNIHGVNYRGDAFSYHVADPARPDSGAGGELIDAFAAGGTTCCFTLPKIWRPGIKVQISTTHWLPKLPDNGLPEVKETHIAEVPRYADGKPGELWVLRTADGSISLISSDIEESLRVPDDVKCLHLVAAHEFRRSFQSIRFRWEASYRQAAGKSSCPVCTRTSAPDIVRASRGAGPIRVEAICWPGFRF